MRAGKHPSSAYGATRQFFLGGGNADARCVTPTLWSHWSVSVSPVGLRTIVLHSRTTTDTG